MIYFKDENNQIHAFDDDAPSDFVENAIKERSLVEISKDEASAILNPPKSLDELKAAKLAELEAVAHKFDNELVCAEMVITSSLGYAINADLRSQNNIRGLLAVIGDSTVQFLDANNELHAVSKADLEIMLSECAINGQNLYAQKWAMRAAIETATSEDELNAIQIKFEMKDFSAE